MRLFNCSKPRLPANKGVKLRHIRHQFWQFCLTISTSSPDHLPPVHLVHLHDHFGFELIGFQTSLKTTIMARVYEVRCTSALHRCVNCSAFCAWRRGPLGLLISGSHKRRQRPFRHSRGLWLWVGIGHVLRHAGIALEVFVDIALRGTAFDAEIAG